MMSGSSRLCSFCEDSIFQSIELNGLHHHSPERLHDSLYGNCYLCRDLYSIFHQKLLEKQGLRLPLYRWTFRRIARSSEQDIALLLIFRPLSHNERSPSLQDLRALVLDRQYILLSEESHDASWSGDCGSSTNSARSWACVRQWMTECEAKHDECRSKRKTWTANSFQPKRLLDLSVPLGAPIRILETNKTRATGPYATLSHSWGTNPIRSFNADTQDEFLDNGLPWDALPLNFQEAIIATRILDVRYLWIDTYCIKQETSSDKGDFAEQGPLMHKIYRKSLFSIAAADSTGASSGLFRTRTPASTILPPVIRAETKLLGGQVWRLVPKALWDSELLQCSLYGRAWCFQERMLAPRIIHFARDQIFWDCANISACESFPSGLPSLVDTIAATDRHWRQRLQDSDDLQYQPMAGPANDSLERLWATAVTSYSRCALTKRSDKLVAIWGVAKLVGDAKREKFYEGLWQYHFEEQLTWIVSNGLQADGSASKKVLPPFEFPTWSWTSVDGIIDVPSRIGRHRDWTVKDHEGNSITTILEGRVMPEQDVWRPSANSPQWRAELEKMGEYVADLKQRATPPLDSMKRPPLDPKRSSSQSVRSSQQSIQKRDDLPRLSSAQRALQLSCPICKAPLRKLPGLWSWSIDIPGADRAFQAFPDEPPVDPSQSVYFIILAFNCDEADDDRQIGAEEVEPCISGIGLLLQPASNRKNYLWRVGSLRFDRIPSEMMAAMQETYVRWDDQQDVFDQRSQIEDAEDEWKIWLE